jgi:hypothetical protein
MRNKAVRFQLNSETITSLFFIILSCAYLFFVKDYAPGARLIPTIVSIATIGIAIIQLVGHITPILRPIVAEKSNPEEQAEVQKFLKDPVYKRRTAIIVIWTLLLYFLIYMFGAVIGIPVFIMGFLLVFARLSIIFIIMMTLALGAFTFLIVVVLLELPLLSGFLWTLII